MQDATLHLEEICRRRGLQVRGRRLVVLEVLDAAVDAKTGKTIYRFRSNDSWRATPMTYTVDGRQYIAAMVGQVLWAFALGYE
jgi:hypothetical protein